MGSGLAGGRAVRIAALALALASGEAACPAGDLAEADEPAAGGAAASGGGGGAMGEVWATRRAQMVERQIAARDVTDERVLEAMRTVPRHRYVPAEQRELAYQDHPLPIGHGQTISQPYIVALMTQLAELSADETVLEIGTGSGYQAAVLGELAREVHTVEIVESLCGAAAERLAAEGYEHVHVHCGDGYQGWPEAAPFDAVVVTAAPERVPQPLVDQLAPGGRLVVPVGPAYRTQWLTVLSRDADGALSERALIRVAFVPMTGEALSDDR